MDFFSSDLHLGHLAILEHTLRGTFLKRTETTTVAQHDRWVVDTMNEHVKLTDNLWFLGDLSTYRRYEALGWIEQINGHKRLILGNHDFANAEVYREAKSVFEDVLSYHELKLNKQRFPTIRLPNGILDTMVRGTCMVTAMATLTTKQRTCMTNESWT